MKDKEMEGKSPLEQAHMAITAMLRAVQNNPHLAYYVGPFSNAWQKLSEASATLEGKPIEEVRTWWINKEARDPKADFELDYETAKKIGWKAFKERKDSLSNPFASGNDDLYTGWEDGFLAARYQAEDGEEGA